MFASHLCVTNCTYSGAAPAALFGYLTVECRVLSSVDTGLASAVLAEVVVGFLYLECILCLGKRKVVRQKQKIVPESKNNTEKTKNST